MCYGRQRTATFTVPRSPLWPTEAAVVRDQLSISPRHYFFSLPFHHYTMILFFIKSNWFIALTAHLFFLFSHWTIHSIKRRFRLVSLFIFLGKCYQLGSVGCCGTTSSDRGTVPCYRHRSMRTRRGSAHVHARLSQQSQLSSFFLWPLRIHGTHCVACGQGRLANKTPLSNIFQISRKTQHPPTSDN